MKKVLSLCSVVLCLIAVVIWQIFSISTNYYIVCAVILVLSMIPFFVSFERSKPNAREIALISALTAIAVVSRGVFYLIPQVKPIGAVVIVSAVCLGAKRGYLIGVMSAFVSNFIFGQGMWTPFQMVALGAVGFIAGVVFKKIKAGRISLAVSGFVLCFAVYSLIVDLSTVLMLTTEINFSSVLTVYLAGIPFNLTFGISTAIFLLLFGEPFIKKINRITTKYGILQ